MSDDPSKVPEDIRLQQFTNFFTVVGYAITQWGHIDDLLFEFCHFALGVSEEKAAMVFHRSPHILEHANFVDKLMQLSLPGKHKDPWAEIVSGIRKHVDFRNHIAHNAPRHSPYEPYTLADLMQERPAKMRLDPYEIVTAKTKLLANKTPALSGYNEIVAHITVVGVIYDQMKALRSALPRRSRKQRATVPPPKASQRKARGKRTRPTSARRQRPR